MDDSLNPDKRMKERKSERQRNVWKRIENNDTPLVAKQKRK